MLVDFQALSAKQTYLTMIQCIIPRPIAWVVSDNGNGTCNLAPFSYFNGVSSRPPIVFISSGKKRDGSKKDTWVNIEEREFFVVNIPRVTDAKAVSDTSASLDFGISEPEQFAVELAPCAAWQVPRLKDAPIAFYCRRYQIQEIGEVPQALIFGQVLAAYVDDRVLSGPDLEGVPQIAADKVNPLARLGGSQYAGLTEPFTVPRPE